MNISILLSLACVSLIPAEALSFPGEKLGSDLSSILKSIKPLRTEIRKLSKEFAPIQGKIYGAAFNARYKLEGLSYFSNEIIQVFTQNPEIDQNTADGVLKDLENLEKKFEQLRDFSPIAQILEANGLLNRALITPSNLPFITEQSANHQKKLERALKYQEEHANNWLYLVILGQVGIVGLLFYAWRVLDSAENSVKNTSLSS